MSKKLSLNGSGASQNQKKFPDTITQKISETNSTEIAHNGKSLISIFPEFS